VGSPAACRNNIDRRNNFESFKKIEDFIAKFQEEFQEDMKSWKGFNLNNIRVVFVCVFQVPDYLRKYSAHEKRNINEKYNEPQTGPKLKRELNEFLKGNKVVKKENLFILNESDFKQMLGPTFQILWESIVNEKIIEVKELEECLNEIGIIKGKKGRNE